jgi:hypothetical protein
MTQVERFANEAVFILQLNTREAQRYTQRNASCSETMAQNAIKQAMTWYRQK